MTPSSGMASFRADVLLTQRQMAGLSCEELALLAHVSPETVRRAEKGRSKPSARVTRALAGALRLPLEELAPPAPELTLKQLRQQAGATQRDVAGRAGVSTQMVSRVENGVYGVKDKARWAHAYGVTKAVWTRAWAVGRADRQRRIRSQPGKGGGTE
ncbi:helix-turn-helix transcriptional regulator [Streptomyces sp. H27-H5]|uniref:helix-turn-helix transcriptional regulator n=1 Tax=Streptomyces sp. H27-H5 TaxID=2996460 RepID=UPI00226F23CA|nr:helix-turn-helix transcriptional regulator [Streptomyces sp. H27-H5]MCY0961809.1 helix-turn-helix transcriptional regulator [Streptomyces sp. H27-H5]